MNQNDGAEPSAFGIAVFCHKFCAFCCTAFGAPFRYNGTASAPRVLPQFPYTKVINLPIENQLKKFPIRISVLHMEARIDCVKKFPLLFLYKTFTFYKTMDRKSPVCRIISSLPTASPASLPIAVCGWQWNHLYMKHLVAPLPALKRHSHDCKNPWERRQRWKQTFHSLHTISTAVTLWIHSALFLRN